MDELIRYHAATGTADAPEGSRPASAAPPAIPARTSPIDAVAQAALATIHGVTGEVARLVRATALRAADGTPVAPILRSILDAIAPVPADSPTTSPTGNGDASWQARVVDAEAALAREVQRASQLEERFERMLVEHAEARERESALRAELATTLERACAEREGLSRRADQLVASAEDQRAAAARDAEAARAALASAQQSSLAQRNELSLARSEAARQTAIAEEARQGREQLDGEVQALRTRLGEAHERLRTLELDAARAAEERRRLELAGQAEVAERDARAHEQVSTLQAEHARERDRAQALTEELERQRAESDRLERREQRMRDEVRAITARAESDREETVRRAQEMVQAAEQARAAATAELERLRSAIAGEHARLVEMEAETERVTEGAAASQAELADARALVQQLEASRAAVVADAEQARARSAETERELLAAQHELGLAQRQLDKLCTAHDELTEDHARAEAMLEEARTRDAELRARTDELREQVCALEIERARLVEIDRQHQELVLQHTHVSGRSAEADAEIDRQRERMRAIDDALGKATTSLEQASARERRLQDELAAAVQRASEYEDTLREARTFADVAEQERASAVAEMEALRTAMASSQRMILEAEEETRVARAEAERLAADHEAALGEQRRLEALVADGSRTDRPAKPAPAAAAAAKPAAPPISVVPPDARKIAILDVAAEWPTPSDIDLQLLVPSEPVIARLTETTPGRCLVNLAAPSAIDAVAAIRMKALPISLWGCVVAADGDRGFWTGVLEVFPRPIDADMIRTQLVAVAPKSARILAVGSDSGTFIPLRQGLMKAGMSVSIAWDLKQAGELLDIVRPHVVVLDLSLPPRGAAAFVLELSRAETPPVLAVIPGSNEAMAALATALTATIPAEGARTRANLLRTVTDAAAHGAPKS